MKRLLLIAFFLTLLIGCANAGAGDPATTVEQYLQAKVDGDADAVRALICSEMEAAIEREAHTFESVSGVEIEGMACTFDGQNRVTCDGRIVALYGAEETEFPLTTYRVIQEDGEWKWCGEG